MRAYTHDEWAGLSFVPDLSDNGRPPTAPTWVDDVDARRLTAYRVLAAFRDNVRRYWLPDDMQHARITMGNRDGYIQVDRPESTNWREYGDPALLVDTARALILGEDQSIELADDEQPAAADPVLTWVQDWAGKERLTQKLLTGESNTVGLGDGVYVLAPDPGKGRPRLRVYDPGFYFPDTQTVVDGWVEDDYPPIVHIAWEEEDTQGVAWVVRSTWMLRRLDVPRPAPWGGEPQVWACWFRKVRYRVDHLLDGATVYSPEISRGGQVLQDWTDLGVDFIPVVHVPNTPTASWGKSVLVGVGQILEDIAGTDTDLATGAQTSANPTFVSQSPVAPLRGVPGEQLGIPEGTTAGWTDTSKNLAALTGYLEHLLDRLAVNSRLALSLLGRVQPNDVPSGYALALGFHPARQLMRESRTVRDEKFPLILRFAVRLAMVNRWLPAGGVPDLTISLGASLPADLPQAIATVKELLPVHGVSTATAVRILIDAGLPIEDAQAEVTAILRERFEDAVNLFEATGNAAAAAKMLGVDPVVVPPLQA